MMYLKRSQPQTDDIRVDSEGYVTCPDCGEKKKCGTAGPGNIMKNHRGTMICKETKAKKERLANRKDSRLKNGSLLNFLWPKAKPVPAAVTAAPVQLMTSHSAATLPEDKNSQQRPPEQHQSHTKSALVHQLHCLSLVIPSTIPEATEMDVLARFANLAAYDKLEVSADHLWEEALNPLMKEVLGWSADRDLKEVVR